MKIEALSIRGSNFAKKGLCMIHRGPVHDIKRACSWYKEGMCTIQRGPVHDKNKGAPNDSGAGPNADAIEEDRGTLAIPEVDLDEVQPYPHLQSESSLLATYWSQTTLSSRLCW